MNRYLKEFIKRFFLGFPMGVFISATIALIIAVKGNVEMYKNLDFYVRAYLCGGLIAAIFSGCGTIFDIEKWSLLKQSFVHMIITIPSMMVLAMYAGWVNNVWTYLLSAITIYAVIYGIFFSIEKRKVEKINNKLNEKL